MQRRSLLKLTAGAAVAGIALRAPAAAAAGEGNDPVKWFVTTASKPWQRAAAPALAPLIASPLALEATIALGAPQQTIDGFGGAFSELGWQALSGLRPDRCDAALDALFGSELGSGAALTMARTPMGASDFARKWYSYAETPGDFPLDHFSVANDRDTLIPYIRAALDVRPSLRVWGSPWSPPTWMKRNGHYAAAPAWPGQPSNGIRPDQLGREGEDMFILEPRYLDAYARYFRRYVEAYRDEGIRISAVMPQNEFNSPQPFPSCCWTPKGLSQFLPHLGREMEKVDVDILLGTLERAKPGLIDEVLADPEAGPLVKGVGVQWAGKGALSAIHARHPQLPIWGSEQECGRGTNDWHYARYGWDLMKTYFRAGTTAWHYWNMVLPKANISTWGWPQNSLIHTDGAGDFRLTHDYWVLRHLSAFVKPGARFIPAPSFVGYENQLAFRNPDGSLVLVVQNALSDPLPMTFGIGKQQLAVTLPADSFSTITIDGALLGAA